MTRFIILTVLVLAFASFSFAQQTGADLEQSLIKARAVRIEAEKAEKAAKDALKKADTPAMKQARKELEKEQKEAEKAVRRSTEAEASVGLSGCRTQAETDAVRISPSVGTTRELRYNHNNSVEKVTITNVTPHPWLIKSLWHGVLVENLCSGGSLTLTFASSYDHQGMTDALTAVNQSLGAGTVMETCTIDVNVYHPREYSSRRLYTAMWNIGSNSGCGGGSFGGPFGGGVASQRPGVSTASQFGR